MASAIVVLDGTQSTADLVGELSRAGTPVTAVGTTFNQVVSILGGDVYALVADVNDPEQWATALVRAARRNGTVEQILDPAGLLVTRAA